MGMMRITKRAFWAVCALFALTALLWGAPAAMAVERDIYWDETHIRQ